MIKYMISLGKNDTLSLKAISVKLVTLFALTCPKRISAWASLVLRHCNVLPEEVSFTLTVPRETGSADKPAEAFLTCFDHDKKLCPIECFRQYLKLSRNVRPLSRLLFPISCLSHLDAPINRSCLQRWGIGYELLSAVGIDSQILKFTPCTMCLRQQLLMHLSRC